MPVIKVTGCCMASKYWINNPSNSFNVTTCADFYGNSWNSWMCQNAGNQVTLRLRLHCNGRINKGELTMAYCYLWMTNIYYNVTSTSETLKVVSQIHKSPFPYLIQKISLLWHSHDHWSQLMKITRNLTFLVTAYLDMQYHFNHRVCVENIIKSNS